jgi:hypothetical protein
MSAYQNIATTTTTVVKAARGRLQRIVVNKAAANAVITVYDNTAGSGSVIATITYPAALLSSQDTLEYDVELQTGLTVVTATAAVDLTVVYD